MSTLYEAMAKYTGHVAEPINMDATMNTSRSIMQHLAPRKSSKVHLNLITNRNAEESPLLRLPDKVKRKIYGYVLGGKVLTLETDTDTYEIHARPKLPNALALLHVCRQTYKDSAHLPFELNTFSNSSILQLNSAFRTLTRFRTKSVLDAVTSIHINHTLVHEPEFWRYHYGYEPSGFWAMTFSEIRSLLTVYPALTQAHFDVVPKDGPRGWIVWEPMKKQMYVLKWRMDALYENLRTINPGVKITISLHVYREEGRSWHTWG